MKIEVNKKCDRARLYDELMEIAALRPDKNGMAQVSIAGNDTTTQVYVPDNLSKPDLERAKQIIDNHQSLTGFVDTIRRWGDLAIAFHSSRLYTVHLRQATAKSEQEWCDRLWWCDKDLTTIFTAWLGDEASRVTKLEEVLVRLFNTLKESGFPASVEDKNQIIENLKKFGFEDLSKKIQNESPVSKLGLPSL